MQLFLDVFALSQSLLLYLVRILTLCLILNRIWDLSLERDEEEEAEFKAKTEERVDAPADLPPQLLFVHQVISFYLSSEMFVFTPFNMLNNKFYF